MVINKGVFKIVKKKLTRQIIHNKMMTSLLIADDIQNRKFALQSCPLLIHCPQQFTLTTQSKLSEKLKNLTTNGGRFCLFSFHEPI